ncbi:MarR family winged helix-turn-helix transcriptional regulator [Periweissella ghanensis]|uniref:HTH marR-type domain-containing protein n=1 Tax=Periweissella ghanensis TaxID=467997 RepID=A0ABM8ZBD3_9LACO|nr:MarR family transcriptional regulator [Periweissella ghanensis]MCM0601850.1 MarR family transcriptional regulator [Periweissella ghanensis]CAH0418837.1 hypothetical protein WGH24286_01279 [Periweissella ghanensis]
MEAEHNGAVYDQMCLAIYNSNRYFHKLYQLILEDYDLTYLQYLSIFVTWRLQGAQLKDICDNLELASSTLTPVVQKLVQKGWLLKQTSKTDGRVRELVVAPSKAHHFEDILARIGAVQDKLITQSPLALERMLIETQTINKVLLQVIQEEEHNNESRTN